jgi:hypothetical protein
MELHLDAKVAFPPSLPVAERVPIAGRLFDLLRGQPLVRQATHRSMSASTSISIRMAMAAAWTLSITHFVATGAPRVPSERNPRGSIEAGVASSDVSGRGAKSLVVTVGA